MRESANPSTNEMNFHGILFILNRFSFDIILIFIYFVAILPPVSPILPLPRSDPHECLISSDQKWLTFEQEMGLSLKPQIEPLLSEKIAQPKNLQIYVMKCEFSKSYSEPEVQWHKRESSNAEEVNSDFVSDERLATELGPHYVPPCSQLT